MIDELREQLTAFVRECLATDKVSAAKELIRRFDLRRETT